MRKMRHRNGRWEEYGISSSAKLALASVAFVIVAAVLLAYHN